MRKALSGDIRELALKKLANGQLKCEIARELNVTSRSIYNWEITAKNEGGRTKPIGYGERNIGRISSLRKIKPEDEEEFKVFLNKNRFKTRNQIVDIWYKNTGKKISTTAIKTFIERNNITRKKKHHITKRLILFYKNNIVNA